MGTILELRNISKSFNSGSNTIVVHDNFNMTVDSGEMVAIMGKSGSGKTTLLNIIAGIDYPDSGEYIFDGNKINLKNTSDGVKFRCNNIGIVLQHFALINDFTVEENVNVALWETKLSSKDKKTKVESILKKCGIYDLRDKTPASLSGGEKQRVAIARALVGEPKLLLADEPTGALDSETENEIMALIKTLNKELKTTVILITHDKEVSDLCDRTVVLKKH
ncbi:MAG: ABC transporter ATP-binding protein [Clostridia bacterium]|nr:ABC transporter ATP-binding protein [Clostridia bacterium]